MISIVVFKWEPVWHGIPVKNKLHKAKNPVSYGSEHVNVLYHSLKRNTSVPFRFFCVTDNNDNIDRNIEVVNLWDKCRNLGGCLNRMFVFDESMERIFGKRFLCVDLDCVIVANIDNILNRSEEFIINRFESKNIHPQIYNGGLFMMNAGSRKQVWEKFNTNSVKIIEDLHNEKGLIGDDQTWIQYILGPSESLFTAQDGVYDYNFINQTLPKNAKIILFPGKYDPSVERNKVAWIKDHWRM